MVDRHNFHHAGRARFAACALLLCVALGQAQATELVYVPVNPNFGGSPLNGASLLATAQSQNKHKDPDSDPGREKQSALQQFNESLQRSVLSRLAAAATANVVGADGKLQPGTVETTDFLITITDIGGGNLRVVTTDKTTGAVTTFEVGV